MNNIIIPYKFDMKVFYEQFLPCLERNECDVIDMRECGWIENGIIPNMLILGETIKEKKQDPPLIFLPRDGERVKEVRDYLDSIGFTELAKLYNLYDTRYLESLYGEKPNRKVLPKYCITRAYNSGENDESRQNAIVNMLREIRFVYSNIFRNHLAQFDYVSDEKNSEGETVKQLRNNIQDFVMQLISNSIEHGRKKVFFSMQGNKKQKTCTFSVSDNGVGMDESIRGKLLEGGTLSMYGSDTYMGMIQEKKEKAACIEAFAYRFDKKTKYGLFNVMSEIFALGGTIEVHTGGTRLIFEPRCKEYIGHADTRGQFAMGLYNYISDNAKSAQRTALFMGTHICITIPTEKKDIWHDK